MRVRTDNRETSGEDAERREGVPLGFVLVQLIIRPGTFVGRVLSRYVREVVLVRGM